MSLERTLQLKFTTTNNKTYQISIVDARADLSDSNVTTAMNDIIALNVFAPDDNGLSTKKSASLITKEITEFSLV